MGRFIHHRKLLHNIDKQINVSASQSTGSEVLAGQKAVISCAFTGITQQLDSITWLRSDGTLVSFLDNFEVEVGDYNRADNSQVTTLTVLGAENSADNIYICQFTSLEWARVGDRSTTVSINVFGRLWIIKCGF